MVIRTKASASIRSSCWLRRRIGPSAFPAIVPMALNSSTRPNHTTEAFWLRSRNASWKVRKPTIARTTAIPEAASTTPPDRSSSFSLGPAGVAATTSRRNRVARPVATMYSSTAKHSVMRTSISLSSTAGSTTTKPAMPASRPSLELASTSSPSSATTVGTSALLEIAYDLASTRNRKARGNSQRLEMYITRKARDDGPAGAGDDHHQAPSTLHPVERRAEQRGDHGEGRHGQQQVEGHLAAGGLRADVEEQGAGERDGHRGVAGRRRGVGPGEPGEGRDDEPAGEVLGRPGRAVGSARPVRRPERLPRGWRAHCVVRSPPLGRFAALTGSALRRSGGRRSVSAHARIVGSRGPGSTVGSVRSWEARSGSRVPGW